jgi:excisionase family DNA binding protein
MADLLNLKEGAKELRISIHTMRAWTYQKRIPIVRLGRRILVRRQDLEVFINKNVVEARE